MDKFARLFYQGLMVGACLSMLAAFGSVLLNIVSRIVGWSVPGLDGYAGYSIAAALFLALPSALRHGDHIRVTLILQRVGPRARNLLEIWGLVLGSVMSLYLAWFACRLAWLSYKFNDVASTGDATPLWIPQLTMALGCVGFAVAFVHALIAHTKGLPFFVAPATSAAHIE